MEFELRCAHLSNPGKKRTNNEDLVHVEESARWFLVVDGVGGQAAGEVAASMAVDAIRRRMARPDEDLERKIREAILLANHEILEEASNNPQRQGMACVLSLVALVGNRITIGHVGDTRVYLATKERIVKLTRDHSPVGEREDEGSLSEIEAMRHPRRNEVYRDIGTELHDLQDPQFIEIFHSQLPENGALLLCTDGLTDLVTQADIHGILLHSANDPARAAGTLIQAALDEGGKDNVSVVLVYAPRFGEPSAAPSAARHNATSTQKTGKDRVPKSSNRTSMVYTIVFLLLLIALIWYFIKEHKQNPQNVMPDLTNKRTVWYVGGEENESSISDALTKATAGDLILVTPGTYLERLLIDKDVTLIARERGQTIISPPAQNDSGPLVNIVNTSELYIGGFVFQGSPVPKDAKPIDPQSLPKVAVQIQNAKLTLVDCSILRPLETGVEVSGSSQVQFRGNKIIGCPKFAVVVRTGASANFQYNIFADSGEKSKPLLVAEVGSQPLFLWNFLVGNATTEIEGLSSNFKSTNQIIDNRELLKIPD